MGTERLLSSVEPISERGTTFSMTGTLVTGTTNIENYSPFLKIRQMAARWAKLKTTAQLGALTTAPEGENK